MTDTVDIAALRELIAENASGGIVNVTVWSDELTVLLDELATLREAAKPTLRPMSEAEDQGPVLAWHTRAGWITVEYDDDLPPEYPWSAWDECAYATDELAGWIPLPPNPEVL